MVQSLEMVALWVSCPNKANAVKISKELVKKKLVFFCQIFPVDSFYWWEKKVFPDKQFVIFSEAYKKDVVEIEEEITRLHKDAMPCWSVFKVDSISKASQKWIQEN